MKWSVGLPIAIVVSTAGILTTSCSQGGVTGKAPPRALLDGRLDQAFGNNCEVPGATRTLGTFGATPLSVADGTEEASVACTVKDNGNNSYDKGVSPNGVYVVGMQVTLSGAGPNGGPSIPYVQSDGGCQLRYVEPAQGLAGGRAWGVLECPRVAREIDGGVDPAQSCAANVTFRFENCGL